MPDTWGVFDKFGLLSEFVTEKSAISYEIQLVAAGEKGIRRGPVCRSHPDQCAWDCDSCTDEENTIDPTKHGGWDGDC